MEENRKYYRIVYFKNGTFSRIEITNSKSKVKRLIYTHQPDVEVYRCNANGNNYTGRKIYPYEEVWV